MKKFENLVHPHVEWIQNGDVFRPVEVALSAQHPYQRPQHEMSGIDCFKEAVESEDYNLLKHSHVHFLMSDIQLLHEEVANISGIKINQTAEGWILTVSLAHLFDDRYDRPILEGLRDAICNEFELWKYDIGCEAPAGGPLSYPVIIALRLDGSLHGVVSRVKDSFIRSYNFFKDHIYYTCKVTCDRGVSQQLAESGLIVTQESVNKCNYNTEDFQHKLTYVCPSGWEGWPSECQTQMLEHFTASESIYNFITYKGVSHNSAMAVLPLGLKCETAVTGSISEWKQFFKSHTPDRCGLDMSHVIAMMLEKAPSEI